MRVIEIDWNPSNRRLRQFAGGMLIGVPLLSWVWSGRSERAAAIGFVAGLVLAGMGLAWPKGIKPLYLALSAGAWLLGFLLVEVPLVAVFFGLFMPVGLFFRLIGRDPLQKKRDPEAPTYWQEKRPAEDPASYLRQW